MSLNRTRANQLKKLRTSNLRNTKCECHACVCVRTRARSIRFNDSIKSVQNTQRSFIHIDEFFKFQSTGLVRAFQMSVDRACHGFPTFSREGSLRLFNFQLTESVRAFQRSVNRVRHGFSTVSWQGSSRLFNTQKLCFRQRIAPSIRSRHGFS